MMNKNERMEALKNAGINTGKYFSVNLPEGLAPGATIHLVIDENGVPVITNENNHDPQAVSSMMRFKDEVANQIFKDGYVKNTRLFRRFVMAQMFQFLNYVSYDKSEKGFHACLRNNYPFQYTFKMMLEEVRVLSKLETRDHESFVERSHFFTKEVVLEVMEDYMDKLAQYVETLQVHKCKGVPYKRVKGINVFIEDIDKKIYAPLRSQIIKVKYAKSYGTIYIALRNFANSMAKLPYDTPKSKAWIDAFKGEGSYYTLLNLVRFHNCGVFEDEWYVKRNAERIVKERLDEYKGEGWKMFAFMKKVIADNHFDFSERMNEIYKK